MATQQKRKNGRVARARRNGVRRRARSRPRTRENDTRRRKISTTIAPEGYAYLRRIIRSRRATGLAQALDVVLEEARRIENRERLERLTEEGYANMSPEALEEEKELVAALTQSVGEIDFDE